MKKQPTYSLLIKLLVLSCHEANTIMILINAHQLSMVKPPVVGDNFNKDMSYVGV